MYLTLSLREGEAGKLAGPSASLRIGSGDGLIGLGINTGERGPAPRDS
jgi:hypothetical protein